MRRWARWSASSMLSITAHRVWTAVPKAVMRTSYEIG
jgi:hypothetical protein